MREEVALAAVLPPLTCVATRSQLCTHIRIQVWCLVHMRSRRHFNEPFCKKASPWHATLADISGGNATARVTGACEPCEREYVKRGRAKARPSNQSIKCSSYRPMAMASSSRTLPWT